MNQLEFHKTDKLAGNVPIKTLPKSQATTVLNIPKDDWLMAAQSGSFNLRRFFI